MAIITLIKYKLRIEYAYLDEIIPNTMVWAVNSYTVLIVFLSFLLPSLTIDRKISDVANKAINYALQGFILISLSALSLFNFFRLKQHLKRHNSPAYSRFIGLEVMI